MGIRFAKLNIEAQNTVIVRYDEKPRNLCVVFLKIFRLFLHGSSLWPGRGESNFLIHSDSRGEKRSASRWDLWNVKNAVFEKKIEDFKLRPCIPFEFIWTQPHRDKQPSKTSSECICFRFGILNINRNFNDAVILTYIGCAIVAVMIVAMFLNALHRDVVSRFLLIVKFNEDQFSS